MMYPVHDPLFWRGRFEEVEAEERPLHQAVFKCPTEKWLAIECKHRKILARHVHRETSILDVGCGWGRLLNLLPANWIGRYVGYDLCENFIELAKLNHPDVEARFRRMDFTQCRYLKAMAEYQYGDQMKYDLAVLISFRPMIIRNSGESAWKAMEEFLKKVSRRRLYLEYDEDCEGFLEE